MACTVQWEKALENSNVTWTEDDKGRKKVSLTLIT